MTRYTRASDGVRIAFQYFEGADPVIFAIHGPGHQFGLMEANAAWRDLHDALRGDNAWTLADLRGVGLSGPYEGSVTNADFVLDLEAVLEQLPGRQLAVVAFLGASASAVEFVAAHQHRVSCLFLLEPTIRSYSPALIAALRADWEQGWLLAARSAYDWADEGELKQMVREWVRDLPEATYWDQLRAVESVDIAPRLRSLEVPIVMRADESNHDATAELAASIPNSVLDITHDLLLNRRNGERIRELIEPFLVGPPSASPAAAERSDSSLLPAAVLTDRQLEVLRLVTEGHTNAAIAEALTISPGTVARHVSDILGRTGLNNRTQLARYAMERGIVQD